MQAKHFSYTLNFIGPKITLTFEGQLLLLMRPLKIYPEPENVLEFLMINSWLNSYKYSLEIRNLKLKEKAKDENYEFLTVFLVIENSLA